MNIIISACLLGTSCRYDGMSKPVDFSLLENSGIEYKIIPVCPELLGGLPVPRTPCEISDNRVISKNGKDFTEEYITGGRKVLETALSEKAVCCILKERSPSCASSEIYDGSFCGKAVKGQGITTKIMRENGFMVFSENELSDVVEYIQKILKKNM